MEKLVLGLVASSSHDEDFVPNNIINTSENPKQKLLGWKSQRFCVFPQTLVFKITSGRCRIRKIQLLLHHFMIPQRASLFIALGSDSDTVEFKKLGFVDFSDNSTSGFKTRELKSIDIDAECEYIKFEFDKCHVNQLNLYNQISIMALSVLGYKSSIEYLQDKYSKQLQDQVQTEPISRRDPQNAAMWGIVDKKKISNQTMDLKWDLYQDETLRRALNALQDAKQVAIEEERFTEAKIFKKLHDLVLEAGKKVCILNSSKEKALEKEDFDSAQIYKTDIENIKESVLVKLDSYGYSLQGDVIVDKPKAVQKMPSIDKIQPVKQSNESLQPDDIPLVETTAAPAEPPIERPISPKAPTERPTEKPTSPKLVATEKPMSPKSPKVAASRPMSPKVVESSRPTSPKSAADASDDDEPAEIDPNLKDPFKSKPKLVNSPLIGTQTLQKAPQSPPVKKTVAAKQPSRPSSTDDQIPEPADISDKQKRDYDSSIRFFGEYCMKCALAKHFGLRERAVAYACAALMAATGKKPKLCKPVVDKHPVTEQVPDSPEKSLLVKSLETMVLLLIEDQREKIFNLGVNLFQDYSSTIEKSQLQQTADTLVQSLFNRAGDAKVKQTAIDTLVEFFKFSSSDLYLDKSIYKKNLNAKVLKSRFDAILELLKKDADAFETDQVISFGLPYLSHANQQVRDGAIDLFALMATRLGSLDELYDIEPKLKQQNPQTIQLIQERSSKSGKGSKRVSKPVKPIKKRPTTPDSATSSKPTSRPTSNPTSKPTSPRPAKTLKKDEKMCIFCKESRADFKFDESLDLHYWKECPLLSACPFCVKIIEISQLSAHLIRNCKERARLKQCPRCKEVVLLQDYASHIALKTCPVPGLKTRRCPLCHTDVAGTEDAWIAHFKVSKCPGNVRTLK